MGNHTFALLLAAALATAACGGANKPGAKGASGDGSYSIRYVEQRAVFPNNGLKLVVIPDDTTELVQVDVRYDVGAAQDPKGKAGLAHYVEHMMFQHRLWGPDKPATFANLPRIAVFFNAFTNWDSTHYMLQGRKEDLEVLLSLEAARMAYHCETIPDDEFVRELEVVRNEIRQRLGTPEGQIPQALLSATYPEGHPYEQYIGGNDKQISSITKEDVCTFMEQYYVPNRATVIVAGNVDPETVKRQVIDIFGGIPKGKRQPPAGADDIPKVELASKTIEVELDVEKPSLHIMWAIPPRFDDEEQSARIALNVFASNLGGFANDYGFGSGVSPTVLGGARAPVVGVSMELEDNGSVDEALDFAWKALRSAGRSSTADAVDQFAKRKAQQKAQWVLTLESLQSRTVRVADMIQFKNDFDFSGDKAYLMTEMAAIDELDGGAMREFVKDKMRKDNAVIVVVKAKKGARSGDERAKRQFKGNADGHIAREPDIDPAEAMRPLQVPEEPSVLSRAKRFELENGLDVVMLPFESLPAVTIRLVIDAGSAHEPAGQEGIAQIAASMLDPPPGMDALPRLGVSFGGSAGDDTTQFTMRGITPTFDKMLMAFARIIDTGDYNQDGIEARAEYFLESLKSPSNVEQRTFRAALSNAAYGEGHEYSSRGRLTKSSVKEIGRDAAIAFKKKHYTPANSTLVIAGTFDAAAAETYVRETFGEWQGSRVDEPVPADPNPRDEPVYLGIERAQPNPQVTIGIAYPTAAGIDGMEAARLVLTEMLSQRMGRVRTELGSTYGVGTQRQRHRGPGSYIVFGNVDAPRAGESLAFMREMIDGLRNGDNFAVEFAKARRVVLQRLLTEASDSGSVAARLGFMAAYGVDADYYEQLRKRVAVLNPALLQTVVKQEFAPNKEAIVLLGDKASLEKAFSEAKVDGAIIKP